MKPTLLVLAAGVGSRYGGVKQIDAVGLHGETLLDFATYDAKQSGYGKVVYIIRKNIEKDFRERLFDRVARNIDAEYVFQTRDTFLTEAQKAVSVARSKPWGTMHAVLCAKDVIKTPFTVINADDYYGRNAFETLGAHLSRLSNDNTEHAMVGYLLGHTMSKTGTVSRGVCAEKDGYLVSMQEQTKIGYEDDGIVSLIDDKKITLTGNEWVSMNFFGFTPSALEQFSSFWESFIAVNASSEKAECLLPEAVNRMVLDGKGRIKFYTSKENWFGMTYPEDRAIVKAEIAMKIETGYYPATLWEKA
jgi:dTDP-glucose pyrophosphorylase